MTAAGMTVMNIFLYILPFLKLKYIHCMVQNRTIFVIESVFFARNYYILQNNLFENPLNGYRPTCCWLF